MLNSHMLTYAHDAAMLHIHKQTPNVCKVVECTVGHKATRLCNTYWWKVATEWPSRPTTLSMMYVCMYSLCSQLHALQHVFYLLANYQ